MTIQTGLPIEPEDFVANPAPYFSIEETLGVTHSLNTVLNQKVLVIVKGSVGGLSGTQDVNLNYDGVLKDSVTVNNPNSSVYNAFCLTYTEIPGADTADITVTASGVLQDVRIVVQKLLVG